MNCRCFFIIRLFMCKLFFPKFRSKQRALGKKPLTFSLGPQYRNTEMKRQFYKFNELKIIGICVPRPYMNYSDITRTKRLRNYHQLLDKLAEYQKLSHPTPLQAIAMPILLARRHLSVVSKRTEEAQRVTAYLIPIIINISSDITPSPKPSAVILAPTEEICLEIKFFADLFGDFMDVKNTCIYEKSSDQAKQFENVGIIIATPERFLNGSKCATFLKSFYTARWFNESFYF
jgi:superfamily II DNA/RNA helicase